MERRTDLFCRIDLHRIVVDYAQLPRKCFGQFGQAQADSGDRARPAVTFAPARNNARVSPPGTGADLVDMSLRSSSPGMAAILSSNCSSKEEILA